MVALISQDGWAARGSLPYLWPPEEPREGRSSGISELKTGAISRRLAALQWLVARIQSLTFGFLSGWLRADISLLRLSFLP